MATTVKKLAEARDALHKLQTGTKVVRGTFEGRSVEYSEINIDDLRQYIRELEREANSQCKRRPLGVIW